MIRQVCPNCMKSVSLPDDAAGTDAPCPECGEPVHVPARYTPAVAAAPPAVPPPPPPASLLPPPPVHPEPSPMSTVPTDRPAPPPGLVPPPYPAPSTQMEPELPEAPMPAAHGGYTHSWGITFSPRVMAWIPAVGLTLILLFTLFRWVGSYVGGHAVYAQSPWRAMLGFKYVERSVPLEPLLKDLPPVLDKVTSDAALMAPYLILLILAVVIAWAERMVATLDRTRLPRSLQWVAGVWPYRIPVLAGLATIALILLGIQLSRGFGLERAMREAVAEKMAPARQAAGASQSEQAKVDFYEEQELAKYNLEWTTWLYLAVVLHFLVVFGMVGRAWLERRGTNKPPPRLVLQY